MPLTRPPPAVLSSRNNPIPFSPSVSPTITFTLTAGGVWTSKIKCTSENKSETYTFHSKSDSSSRSMTLKDQKLNQQVCKVKSKGEHLLDLNLSTDIKEMTIPFRDMIAFKHAVEKSNHFKKQPQSEYDFEQPSRFIPDPSTRGGVCWAFEYEGCIFQWTAGLGQGINAPPGSDVLLCHSASLGPGTRVAKVQSSHTNASDKLIIFTSAITGISDKTGFQILLLASVLSLMEILNDRSRELLDFD